MRTFVNDRWWVRSAVAHTPAHVVQGWDGKQVTTACGAIPSRGGEVISYDRARQLHVHPCVSCTGMQVTAP